MSKLRLLHLEDSPSDAFLLRTALTEAGLPAEILHASSRADFVRCAGTAAPLDAILVDNGVPDVNFQGALQIARETNPGTPVIVVSSSANPQQVSATLKAGAHDYVIKGQGWQLVCALHRLKTAGDEKKAVAQAAHRERSIKGLLAAVHELSHARDPQTITRIVRTTARELTRADGASVVLREGDQCHYVDEDAIAPLWKGRKFPMTRCVSGWVMTQREALVCPDIMDDPRIPKDVYQATFVKSMVMVPIRIQSPIGAIGIYWSTIHEPSADEVELLQALANTTAVAMESVQLYGELERRVQSRTLQLEAANHELEAFSYSVAHDLRGPLHAIGGYADLVAMKVDRLLDEESRTFLNEIHNGVERMTGLIDDLLRLAKFGSAELLMEDVDLSEIAKETCARLTTQFPNRNVICDIRPDLRANCDRGMLRIVFENLLSNAWKYTARQDQAMIEIGSQATKDNQIVFCVRDNGAGFDPELADKLFVPFQRLHREHEFKGNGVGLATVQRIIRRHGGIVWAESQMGRGATFYFTLPESAETPATRCSNP